MYKRVVSVQGEANPESEVLGGKRQKKSGLGGEVQESQAVVTLDSLERAFEAISTLEGAAQEPPGEAGKELEDGIPAGGPFDANRVAREAPSEITVGSSFLARLTNAGPRRARLPDRMGLDSYVPPQECGCPPLDMVAPSVTPRNIP